MRWPAKTVLTLALLTLAAQAMSQVTFYESEGFRGRAFNTNQAQGNFGRTGFNDMASSVVVEGGRWEACEHENYGGHCVVLAQGSYDSLRSMGLDNRLSSVRRVSDAGNYSNAMPPPMVVPNYEYRRRPDERIYQANISSVRAVMGPAGQRCWTEHQAAESRQPNVGGALLGGLLGGVIGHQIGAGTGRDIATAGGVVAGAVIGANSGRDHGTPDRDVRRCERIVNGTPQYWDVSYEFRGQHHQMQMNTPPGQTVAVNRRGEPRQ